MTRSSLLNRIEKLEGTGSDAGLVIMTCRQGGDEQGAKAYFAQVMGCPIEEKGSLVLERPGRRSQGDEVDAGQPFYKIRSILTGRQLDQLIRDVNGRTRGLPSAK